MLLATLLAMGVAAQGPVDGWVPGSDAFGVAAGTGHAYDVGHSLPGLDFTTVRFSWERVMHPRLALGVEGVPWLSLSASEPDSGPELVPEGDGRAFGFSLLVRWRAIGSGRAGLGLDGGAGLLRFDRPIPERGKELNYTLQIGSFLELPLGRASGLLFGCRIHHTSNKGEGEVNPGINAVHPYVELRLWRGAAPSLPPPATRPRDGLDGGPSPWSQDGPLLGVDGSGRRR